MKNCFLAELVGTFCLVWAGCGAIVVDRLRGGLGNPGIGLVFGLIVMAMIYALGAGALSRRAGRSAFLQLDPGPGVLFSGGRN